VREQLAADAKVAGVDLDHVNVRDVRTGQKPAHHAAEPEPGDQHAAVRVPELDPVKGRIMPVASKPALAIGHTRTPEQCLHARRSGAAAKADPAGAVKMVSACHPLI
jgi:hypothetical protein